MGQVIHVNFRKNNPPYPLRQAKGYLGRDLFNKALNVWSLQELEGTAWATWTDDGVNAYLAVLRYRRQREADQRPACPVVELHAMRKAA